MRNITKWKTDLQKQFTGQTGMLPQEAKRLFDVELGLVLIEQVAQHEPAGIIPALLSGHEFAGLNKKRLGEQGIRMLAVGRCLLKSYRGAPQWDDALRWYRSVAQRFRLFDVKGDEHPVIHHPTSICPHRKEVYLDVLNIPPLHIERSIKYADSNQPWHFLNGERSSDIWNSVRFPEWLIQLASSKTPSERPLNSRTHREPLRIPWNSLLETASWMDRQSHQMNEWRTRMETMKLHMLDGNNSDVLILEGRFNLAGMVSSGKSTLMDVVAVWAAKNGLRTTLVVGDVVDAVTRATMFRELGLSSVPLLGPSNRVRHFERINLVASEEHSNESCLPTDLRLQWVSPICLLDGLSSSSKIIAPGEEPCDALYTERGQRRDPAHCPLMAICPVHQASNDLIDSNIWIATPASLLYTRAPIQATRKRIRLLELVYRESNLVIVDEVDRVQVQLDDAFGPNETLVGETGEGWMDQLEMNSSNHHGKSRSMYLNMETNAWSQAQRLAQQAIDLIITLVSEDRKLRNWVTRSTYFTGQKLFRLLLEDIAKRIGHTPTENAIPQIKRFCDNPFSQDSPLSEIAMRTMVEYPSDYLDGLARDWIKSQGLNQRVEDGNSLVLRRKLFLAVATVVLEHRLKMVVQRWDLAEDAFGLSSDGDMMFQRSPPDYRTLIPDVAMGYQFGFRYSSLDDRSPGGIQFFRCSGIGRWILLHLHDLFEALDGQKGPHTILMSGTSWAPGSMSHHLQLPVDGLLKSPKEQIEAIGQSNCFFNPIARHGEAVRVSGTRNDEKENNLKTITHTLASRQGALGLKSELELLPMDRQRILLVVQSYRQAKIVADELNAMPEWAGKVARLIRDDDDTDSHHTSTIRRGRVYSFAERPECILVAPLLAVERGHNILINDGRAAIGSVFFLVRPMPVPFEMSTALREMNWWALNRSSSISETARQHNRLFQIWGDFRKEATNEWYRCLDKSGQYITLTDIERSDLVWTQLIALWQTVGRTVRGGTVTRVHFCDAAFAPETANGEMKDSPQTSLLVAIRTELDQYMNPVSTPSDPNAQMVTTALYGPWASALRHIAGLD